MRPPHVCSFVRLLALTTVVSFARGSQLSEDRACEAALPEAVRHAGLGSTEWESIRAAHETARHRIVAGGDACQARNPGQRWTTRFDGRGFAIEPDRGTWSFGLELRSYGWEGERRTLERPHGLEVAGARVARAWDESLREWYVNDERGLEHGFTLERRASGARGRLSIELGVRGDLAAEVSSGGRDVLFVDARGATVLSYSGLAVLDADGRALAAGWHSREGGTLELSIEDEAARYPLTVDPIVQQAYLKASNAELGDRFGRSVAISGDTLVVGATVESSGATGVDGDQADNGTDRAGAAYVFVRSGSTWSQQAYLKASNSGELDLFGSSVAIFGDTIAVGAVGEASNATGVDGNQASDSSPLAGAVYVFVRTGTSWSQQAYLKASNTGAGDHFGTSLALSGDTLVVGANQEDSSATGIDGTQGDNTAANAGAAYVFVRNAGTWSQQAYLKPSNTGAGDSFGSSVAIFGATIVVGAPEEDSSATGIDGDPSDNGAVGSGAAYVFVRGGTIWSQEGYLKASNTEEGDRFGTSVALFLDLLVAGAPGEDSGAIGADGNQNDNSADSSGAAYVFARSGTTWSQEGYLKASNTGAGDAFGASAAIAGGTIAVGAPEEDGGTTGVDGDPADNSASASGAGYLYVRGGWSGSHFWTHRTYLKASNTGADDNFASRLALSGVTLVVGAFLEDSNATGVGGEQANEDADGSGAAYVLLLDTPFPIAPYCFGDGSLETACPCANFGEPGHGCANSQFASGAKLSWSGETRPDDTLVLTVTDELASTLTIFLQGSASNPHGVVFGDGLRCVAGVLKRIAVRNASGGTVSYPAPWEPSISAVSAALGDVLLPGTMRWYQTYYRDPVLSFCPTPPGKSWNISSGLAVGW